MKILGGYVAAAQRLGVRFEFGVTVRGMRIEGDRIAALETSRGDVARGRFHQRRRRVGRHARHRHSGRAAAAPGRGDDRDGCALRHDADDGLGRRRLPLPRPRPARAAALARLAAVEFRCDVRWPSWLPQVLAFTNARVPCLRDVPIDPDACWAGLYEMSPDHHAILGARQLSRISTSRTAARDTASCTRRRSGRCCRS